MSEQDTIIAALLEFLNACEAGITSAKKLIAVSKGPLEEGVCNPAKIRWTSTEGSKGSYERSEDCNSSDLKLLIKQLAQHDGKLCQNGYFYWLFKNGSTVGRKRNK